MDTSITRRGIIKAAAGLTIAGLVPTLATRTAEAGVTWCRVDPSVRIAGTPVNFYAWLPQEYVTKAYTPVEFYLKLPLGVNFRLLSTYAGFNGLGELFLARIRV